MYLGSKARAVGLPHSKARARCAYRCVICQKQPPCRNRRAAVGDSRFKSSWSFNTIHTQTYHTAPFGQGNFLCLSHHPNVRRAPEIHIDLEIIHRSTLYAFFNARACTHTRARANARRPLPPPHRPIHTSPPSSCLQTHVHQNDSITPRS